MPDPELKEWISLLKDTLLGLAALMTIFVGLYGVRTWKRDLVGKEAYAASKNLVKESHLVCKGARTLRQPLWPYEKLQFTAEETEQTTKNERWRLSEIEGYKTRIKKFAEEIKCYESAKLDLRVLIGSKVYEGFLPFDRFLIESIERVNTYLDLLQDYSADSSEIIEAQRELYPSDLDDELSQSLVDFREQGEVALLSHLHRKSIYG